MTLHSRASQTLFVGMIIALSWWGGREIALAVTCSNCKPLKQADPYSTAPKFYLQDSWYPSMSISSLLGDEFSAAKSEWNAALINSGSAIRLGWNTSDNAVQVYFDSTVCPDWAETRTSAQINPRVMRICPDLINNSAGWSYVQRIVRHELGHILGLAQNVDCSKAESVMTEIQPEQMGGAATSVGCADANGINEYYPPPPSTDYCDNGGCTPGYVPMGSPGCSEASTDVCGCCLNYSPIILDLAGDGIHLSSPLDGAVFAINDLGKHVQLGWPDRGDDVWLWLDRNGNGLVDSGAELFGNTTRLSNGQPAPHGFIALAELDMNADQVLDARDPSFDALQIWSDNDRNGQSEPNEISPLHLTNVWRIDLSYRESRHTDRYGNVFSYRSVLYLTGERGRTWAWDVYPASVARTGSCAVPPRK